jgi:hypothetical protein
MLRRIVAVILLGAALPLAAQQPPKLEPLPPPPPPPPGVNDSEQPGEQPIEIKPGENQRIEETVINGQRVARVTSPRGTVYYLIQNRGDGPNMGARNESLDPGVRVPLWVIREF